MTSEWRPSEAEIAAIVAGSPIFLDVVGYSHPPVMLHVGDPRPRPASEKSDVGGL